MKYFLCIFFLERARKRGASASARIWNEVHARSAIAVTIVYFAASGDGLSINDSITSLRVADYKRTSGVPPCNFQRLFSQ